MIEISNFIRNILDYPCKGIIYRDITTLLKDSEAFKTVIDKFLDYYRETKIDKIVCIEARGFITGAALAYALNIGFVPIRKKGKLPAPTFSQTYQLEYGIDEIEIHKDAIMKGEHILIHDDVLATGGTMLAAIKLLNNFDPIIVGISCLIELKKLNGRDKLKDYPIYSLIQYD